MKMEKFTAKKKVLYKAHMTFWYNEFPATFLFISLLKNGTQKLILSFGQGRMKYKMLSNEWIFMFLDQDTEVVVLHHKLKLVGFLESFLLSWSECLSKVRILNLCFYLAMHLCFYLAIQISFSKYRLRVLFR